MVLMNDASQQPAGTERLFADHPRRWRQFAYVYPVISRRAGGLSIGINLNVDKVCNFHCVYCQVDRTAPAARRDVDLQQLRGELDWMLRAAAAGRIWDDERFGDTPAAMRRINDIAFSGDGEPTAFGPFDRAVALAAALKAAHGLDAVKLVVLTNATLLHRPRVAAALRTLYENNGEVWAKLDAGTQGYFDRVDRSRVSLERVVSNIASAGRDKPIVIQSMFMRLHGEPIPRREFEAYCDRLSELLEAGCRIALVQLYTVARQPAESYVSPLTKEQLDGLAARLRQRVADLRCEVYYGGG